ncbi:MAG: DEAD/DEAH box helicase [Gemmatimonadota bacterium]
MPITDHQAKYLAHELTRRFPAGSDARLAGALVDAEVDLNPHQVDAALFAFNSPLSKGALLADEVGLGKTIEAGLVILQRWAERKRRILVVTPANLRKQWYQELTEKFALPCRILDAKSFNDAVKLAHPPFDDPAHVLIVSYQFAKSKETDVIRTPWDLAVLDEAHRLRNVYKPSNVIANSLKRSLGRAHKLLLTATPLQNSILELYGLVSFIDEHAFGDLNSFREQFTSLGDHLRFKALRSRLRPLCHRTLRRQVTQYISYTQRRPILEKFAPDEAEDRLYNLVSEYLQRDNLQALPKSQRSLLTLVLRKLLASWGGGFRYYRIAPSLIELDSWDNPVINKQYNPAMLAEALCKLEGFAYAPSETTWWQQGRSTERDYLYVTTANLGPDQLQQLSDEVGPERTLLVLCAAFRGKADRWSNLTVRKIPNQVLSRCEWGRDDYSLAIAELPPAPAKPGQQDLFSAEPA